MLKRTLTAAVGLSLLAIVCVFSDTVAFPIVFGLLSVVGVYEMLGCVGMRRNPIICFCLYVTAVVASVLTQTISSRAMFFSAYGSFLFCVLMILFAASVFSEGKMPVDKMCISFTTCAYIITGFLAIIMLRSMEYGQYVYLLAFLGPWVSDTFAYFCGRLFGKHKLIPAVSPNKTVEGSIGGIVFTVIACLIYGLVLNNYTDNLPGLWIFAVLGLIVSVVSQIGDLIFSLIKRRYSIKDYGFLFPGHGGVLDRFDSVIATAPLILIVCETLLVFRVM